MGNNAYNLISIIGNGAAAAECIRALRESKYAGAIHVLTDSKWPIYNPMLTTYYASGRISFEQLFPYGADDGFYRTYNVELHPSSPVTALDTIARTVVNSEGLELVWDQCLIASGASAFMPPIEGARSEKVLLMRTVEDAVKMKEALDKKPRRALVVGASMIGVKIVEMFHRAGVETVLVDLADRIFPLIAHPECSCVIEDRLNALNVECTFGTSIKKFVEQGEGIRAYLDDENYVEADLAVMCIGVRPNIGFLDRDQVEVQQGVLVDEHMQTNMSGLYAAGDVSQGNNLLTGQPQVIGLWANARYQGRTAGRNMAGIPDTYSGTIPHNITHFMGMDFIGIGDTCTYDRTEQRQDDGHFIQLFWTGDLLTGANFIDMCAESGVVKNALIKGLLQQKPDRDTALPAVQNLLIKQILAEVHKA